MAYSRSVLGGSDEDNSSSVLGGPDEDYSRSVLGGSDEYFSRSLLGGSDEVNDIHCEPCKKEGNTVDAVKHCVDCAEYLCGQCFKSHAKFKAFQNHVTNDITTVTPVTKTSSQITTNTVRDSLSQLEIDSTTKRHMSRRVKAKKSSTKSNKKVTAKLVSSMDVRSISDKQEPYIWALTIVRAHYCVVADDNNKSVKVVDTRQTCVVSEIHISDANSLHSITAVNDDQVAVSVTIKGVAKLVFFSVSTSGIITHTDRSLNMQLFYLGIIYHKDCFYASDENRIHIISMNGQVIKTLDNVAFGWLHGIALSNYRNTIYVCSYSTDTEFSVDLEGNIKATYKDEDLKRPTGVTVESEGYVYVCSTGTLCVHQITADLNKVQVLIRDVGAARCTFNSAKYRLFLTGSDEINVCDLNYE